MIIMSSNGITSKEVAEKFKECIMKIGKNNLKATFITTAGVKEDDECIKDVRKVYDELNIDISFIDINNYEPEILLDFDIIEFLGGNPFFLLKSINDRGYKDVLLQHLEKGKILSGWSAGAFLFQNSINMAYKQTPGMNKNVGLDDFSGLNLVDFEIMPHYQWLVTQMNNLDGSIEEYEKESGYKVYKLKDGQAIFVYEDGHKDIIYTNESQREI